MSCLVILSWDVTHFATKMLFMKSFLSSASFFLQQKEIGCNIVIVCYTVVFMYYYNVSLYCKSYDVHLLSKLGLRDLFAKQM